MSVVRVDEIPMPRTASVPLSGAREYTRAWNVWTDNQYTGAAEVVFSGSIPNYLVPYYTDTFADNYALVVKKTAKQGQSRRHWIVDVNYSTDLSKIERTDAPLEETPEIGWSFASTQVVVEKDRNGAAIVNSAGQPFNPPLTRERYALVLNYSSNVANYDPIVALDYMDTVNNAPFYGAQRGQCRLVKWEAQRKVTAIDGAPAFYWNQQIEIHFLRQGWAEELLDRGPKEKVNNQLVGASDPDSGLSDTEARLLDGNGRFLSPGGEPVYRSFDILEERNFATLGIV